MPEHAAFNTGASNEVKNRKTLGVVGATLHKRGYEPGLYVRHLSLMLKQQDN